MIIFFLFILGSCIGSFLSVCVYRIPQEKSIVKPNSYCPNCNQSIPLYLNIPIIGFIFSKGKCFYCKKKISFLYPILEILCGILFSLLFFVLKQQNINIVALIEKIYFLYFSLFFFFVKRNNNLKLPSIYFELSFLVLILSFVIQSNYYFILLSMSFLAIHKIYYREWFSYNLLLILQIINPDYLIYLIFNILLIKNTRNIYLFPLINIFFLIFL